MKPRRVTVTSSRVPGLRRALRKRPATSTRETPRRSHFRWGQRPPAQVTCTRLAAGADGISNRLICVASGAVVHAQLSWYRIRSCLRAPLARRAPAGAPIVPVDDPAPVVPVDDVVLVTAGAPAPARGAPPPPPALGT